MRPEREVTYDLRCNRDLTQQLFQIVAVLAGMIDDPPQPLAFGMAWAERARRVIVVDRLDRAAGVVERASHAGHHLRARQRGVFLAALLVQIVHAHPASLLI